jgi:polyhydroxyalkanoate synthesis repressor PhaR
MVRQKRDFQVVDAKTGEDITTKSSRKIIMDEEARGTNMLPVNFLRQLISLMAVRSSRSSPISEASLEALQRNQSQMREAVSGASGAPHRGPVRPSRLHRAGAPQQEMFSAGPCGAWRPAPAAKEPSPSPRAPARAEERA